MKPAKNDASIKELDIDSVKNNLSEIFTTFDSLNSLLTSQDKRNTDYILCKKYFESKKYILKQLQDNRYYIAFIGPYSTGKSTLINAILKKDLLPENLEKATTAFPTYLYPVSDESNEKAEIIYCTQHEREYLKRFYLDILANDFETISQDLDDLLKLDPDTLIEKLNELQEDIENFDEKTFDTLCILLQKWELNVGESELVQIADVKEYVESNENSVIISRANIYVNVDLFSGRNDIVLVDLPGVDADNPRHFETTKKFTITEAKSHAYIFVSAPEKIESSKANDFLLELAKHTKQISKAFWVLNRCDLIPEKDIDVSIQQFISNNSKKIKTIDEKRVFAVSAHKYKMDNQDSDSLVKDIDKLREQFIDYLQNEFENELAETNQREYELLKQKLLNFLESKIGSLKDIPDEDQDLAIELELIENKLTDWRYDTEETLVGVSEEISNKIYNLDFFNDDLIENINRKIEQTINEVGTKKDINITLPKDIDKRSPESKIIDFQKGVPLNQFIRAAFSNALENEGGLADIMNCFNSLHNHSDIFKDKKAIHHEIIQRFEGICDIALIGYSSIFQECVPLVIYDRSEINKKYKSFLTLFANESLEETISFNYKKEDYKGTLKEFILADIIYDSEFYEEICSLLDIEDQLSDFECTEEEYNKYIQEIVKYKMYDYVSTLKENLNKYVAVCLTNYFKELVSLTKQKITSREVDLKLRLRFTKEVKENSDLITTASEKRSQISKIYIQYN